MDSAQGLMAQLDALFHPKSVAVVGVPKGMKTGRLFLMALLDQGYPGHIYPVNPQAREIDGLKAYPSVASIPGAVDLAIVLVVGTGLTPEANRTYTESMIQAREDLHKPFVMVNIPGFDPDLAQTFCKAGVPFFETAERAMQTYARVRRYQLWRQKRSSLS